MKTFNETQTQVLLHTKLFSGLSRERIFSLLDCLPAELRAYAPGERVIQEGEPVTRVGLLLQGQARSLKEDAQGRELTVTYLRPGSFMGILLAASRGRTSPVAVEAQTEISVLFLPGDRLLSPCEKNCEEHRLLLRGYLDSVAEHSLTLNDRIDCLLRHSVREKVLTYLQRAAREQGSPEFSVPMDREAMGEYLNIERSALSRELSRMKADGLLDYHKNRFRLLEPKDS